jgi:hypothetical protein
MKHVLKLWTLALCCAAALTAQVNLSATASPATATPGSTVVTLTGSSFPSGTINAAEITVNLSPDPSAVGSPSAAVIASTIQTVVGSTRRVTFLVPATLVVPVATQYRVSLAGVNFSSTNFSTLTLNPVPGILSSTPSTVAPGGVAAALVRTQNGNFVQDAASLSFGAGVSSGRLPLGAEAPQPLFGAAAAPIVVDANTLLTLVRVDPGANTGPRTLTLTQGSQSFTRPDALAVAAGPLQNLTTAVLSLTSPVSPESGTPGSTSFSLAVTGLPASNLAAGQIRLFFEPVAASSSPRFTLSAATISGESNGVRTVGFVVPNTFSFSALTDYSITVYASTSNFGQVSSGLTYLSQNRALIRLGPPPAPAATLSSLAPSSGAQGQSFTLNVNGSNTNFSSATQITLGAGISVGNAAPGQFGPVTVISPTAISAQIRIDAGAAVGLRNLDVRTGSQALSLRNAFTVNPGAFLLSLGPPQPSIIRPGQSVSVVASNFPNGDLGLNQLMVTLAPVRAGAAPARNILATSISALTAGARTVTFTFPPDIVTQSPEFFNISISGQIPNGASFATANPVQVTLQPPARLLSVTPNSGQAGASVSVSIAGLSTNFSANQTQINAGAGISVSNINVQSATLLTATFAIAANASAGPRMLSVTSAGETLVLNNAFSVSGPPEPLTLSSTTSPSTARTGATVSFTALNFPAGPVNPNQWTITLEPASGGNSVNLTPSGIQENATGQRTIFFQIPISLNPTQPTAYLVGLRGINASGAAFTSSNKAAISIEPAAAAPLLSSITPSSGQQGQSLSVTIDVANVSLSTVPQISFGPGITVSNLSLVSPTRVTGNLVISATASQGLRETILTVGNQSFAGRLFSVVAAPAAAPATLTSIEPPIGPSGTSLSVTITGQNTSFTAQSVVSLGPGISPGPITVQSPTQLTTTLNIAADAPPGSRILRVTSGSQIASLPNAFSVVGPQITLISPVDKSFVNTSSITVQGRVNDPGASIAVNGVAAPNNGGSFTVAIPLSEGNNTVTAVATTTGGATSSTSALVNLDTTPPRVAVLSPTDLDETTEESISVAGNVNDIVVGTVNDIQAQVTVNGVAAQVNNRSFVATNIPLQPGINTLSVVARDRVGNAFTASVKVNRVVAPLLRISVISGNNQTARINSQLPQPVVVKLTDGLGIPKPNTPVFFRIVGNNGRVGGALAAEVRTDGQGMAQSLWTIGSRSGAGTNRLEVGATGVTAPGLFTATGLPSAAARIVVDSGLNQTGAVGQRLPLPFVAIVIDEGNNRLGGVPVTMQVRNGGGKIDGRDSLTVNSDPDGRVAQTLTLGPQEGNENNEVIVTFVGNTANPAIFTATGRTPRRVEDTRVSGIVLNNANQPIHGVTVKLLRLNQGSSSNLPQQIGPISLSNEQGYFEIAGAPIGVFKLLADGSTVTGINKYPTLELDITTVAGQNNTLGAPIYLPTLDTKNQLCVDESTGGTLSLPEVPGFMLRVSASSATFPGGSKKGCISVTPVNIDKIPMAPGFGQQPRFVVTIQPLGTTFNPPAALSIPNVDGVSPGSIVEMYSYDHDLASFVSLGNGQVSKDGLVLQSLPGVGVLKAGWHCGGLAAFVGQLAKCPECQKCTSTIWGVCVSDEAANGSGCQDACHKCLNGCCNPDLKSLVAEVLFHEPSGSYGTRFTVQIAPQYCNIANQVSFLEDVLPGSTNCGPFRDNVQQRPILIGPGNVYGDNIVEPLPRLNLGQTCRSDALQRLWIASVACGDSKKVLLFEQTIEVEYFRIDIAKYRLRTKYLNANVCYIIDTFSDKYTRELCP